jgi:hypothetical protein
VFEHLARRYGSPGGPDRLLSDPVVQSWGKAKPADRSDGITRFFAGLDVGAPGQPTGFAVAEKAPKTAAAPAAYTVRLLKRYDAGVPFTEVFADVARLVAADPLPGCTLAVGETAVGEAVVRLLRQTRPRVRLQRVVVTTEHLVRYDAAGVWQLPRKDLLGVPQVLLQGRRLKVARELELAGELLKELGSFRRTVAAAGGIWTWLTGGEVELRQGPSDDVVFAASLALWAGEKLDDRLAI